MSSPDAAIIFYSFVPEDTSLVSEFAAMQVTEVDATPDIIDFQTTKPKGGVGTWSVTLSSRVNYKSMLSPGSWCLGWISDQKLKNTELLKATEDDGFKLCGIIRSVRRREMTLANGVRRIIYSVSGEDFSSIFHTPIYANQNLTALAGGASASLTDPLILLGPRFKTDMSPDELVDALIDSLLGKPNYKADKGGALSPAVSKGRTGFTVRVPAQVGRKILGFAPAQNYFMGLVTKVLQTGLLGKMLIKTDITGVVGIWSLLETYCHRLLNEIYADLLPLNINGETRLAPSIVCRAIPFSTTKVHPSCILFNEAGVQSIPTRLAGTAISGVVKKTGKRLPPLTGAHFYVSKYVEEKDILALDTGKGDRERMNFFFITSPMTESITDEISQLSKVLAAGGLASLADSASVTRYGLRPYIASSQYLTGSKSSDSSIINLIVKDLWKKSYLYENGQVSLIGSREYIPVGTNLVFRDRGWVGHVESVNHMFSVNGDGTKTFRTNVALSRLQKTDGKAIEDVPLLMPFIRLDNELDRGQGEMLEKDGINIPGIGDILA